MSTTFSPHLSYKHSNIQSFLSSVTPTFLSRALQENDGDRIQYFTLGDLWNGYEEWSAYGVGVPIVLNNGVSVTQYYAPHLSAIQIFTNNPQQMSRNLTENEDVASFEDETKGKKIENDKSSSNESIKGFSIEENVDGWGNSPLEADRHGHLYFKFYDTCSPYRRVPFGDKIAELAKEYPGLLTLKNVDLSPTSWMSIAWYPIYHIPTNGNCLDRISTSFLTYHTLSKSSPQEEEGKIDKSGSAFYPFGLATYKLDESIWMNNLHSFDDHERIIDLYNAAESWLKNLDFWHHDFNFFSSHFSMEGLSI